VPHKNLSRSRPRTGPLLRQGVACLLPAVLNSHPCHPREAVDPHLRASAHLQGALLAAVTHLPTARSSRLSPHQVAVAPLLRAPVHLQAALLEEAAALYLLAPVSHLPTAPSSRLSPLQVAVAPLLRAPVLPQAALLEEAAALHLLAPVTHLPTARSSRLSPLQAAAVRILLEATGALIPGAAHPRHRHKDLHSRRQVKVSVGHREEVAGLLPAEVALPPLAPNIRLHPLTGAAATLHLREMACWSRP
jgi:hypothetical protein